MALAVICCLVFLFVAPYLVIGRHTDLGLKTATVFAASRDSYSLSSPVRLVEAPLIALESGTLSMPQSRTGLGRGGEMIAMLITGKSAHMTLENAAFTADFTTNEATYSQGSAVSSMAPLVTVLQKLQFDALTLRDSSIRIKLGDGSELLLDDLNADIASKLNGSIHAVGSFKFRGEKVAFDTIVGARADQQSGAHAIAASIDSAMLSTSLDGTITLGDSPRLVSPKAELTIPKVRDAARWLGAGWPAGPAFENFHVKGQLEWVDRAVAFQNASVQMDGNDATGTLSANFNGVKPALDGTLDLKTLDLTKYTGAIEASNPECLLSRLRSASNLQFPFIHGVDADLRISTGSVVLPRVSIGRSAATISLKGGKMLADIAELEIDDGTRGGGQVRIDTNGAQPSFDIRGKLESLDLGRAGLAVFGHQTVQGRGDVMIEVATAGDSGASLLNALDGKLSVTLDEGGRLGIDIDQLVAAANAMPSHEAWQAASSGAMPIDALDARFAVSKGVIHTESAEAVSGARAMKADGAIDLPSRRLDLEMAIGDRARSESAAEGATPRKREVVEMHGPWMQPSLQPGSTGSTAAP